MIIFSALGFALLGYISGALPFAVWVTRLITGADVRDSGSGHATTTNTIRRAGFGPGVAVLLLDLAKGFLPTYLALKYSPATFIVPVTAAFVIIGHCWPVFAQFRGGMGLASAGGCLLAVSLLAFLTAAAILIVLTLAIRHSARASVFTGIAVAPVLWLMSQRGIEFWVAVAVGLVIAYRFLIDWNRQYRELWLDRKNRIVLK
ncbi:MAG: glycerol-3-phosphate acyltransferase [Chloroflexi bacterium]|nr:glycerol-3-phosphate acyltransferase [Chloroflexota bacterium]MBI3338909.1 glycerol-3-phosphate acyltransferase [Chloroflexota bacterium]